MEKINFNWGVNPNSLETENKNICYILFDDKSGMRIKKYNHIFGITITYASNYNTLLSFNRSQMDFLMIQLVNKIDIYDAVNYIKEHIKRNNRKIIS